jgi:signal peptidase I
MQNKTKYLFWGKAILFALLLVFAVRTFWVESFVISSPQMEDALKEGDHVIVNKTAYGLRLPITPLSVPFAFDNFFGWQSYSTLLELGYSRLGSCKIPVNDVVVFNHPLQTDRPLDKRTLCMGRCVAQPGDLIQIDGFELYVNGRHYQTSPDFRLEYSLPIQWKDSLQQVLHQLKCSDKNLLVKNNQLFISINRLEAYLIQEYLPDTLLKVADITTNVKYQIIIPRKDLKIKLDAQKQKIYAYLIQQEQGKSVVARAGKLFLNGKVLEEYTFQDNYYWLLPDNQAKTIDSNHFGFISEKNIVGKASLIWWSHSQKGIAWSRIFSSVK